MKIANLSNLQDFLDIALKPDPKSFIYLGKKEFK